MNDTDLCFDRLQLGAGFYAAGANTPAILNACKAVYYGVLGVGARMDMQVGILLHI
jgi:hypothetical protein